MAAKPLQALPEPLECLLGNLEIVVESRKRRGRPPRFRNKPNLIQVVPAAPKKVRTAIREAGVESWDREIELLTGPSEAFAMTNTTPQTRSSQAQGSTSQVQKRTRLPDGSRILSRYDWGTQPLLGEGG